jgi:ketosteroid isomerase-like protein
MELTDLDDLDSNPLTVSTLRVIEQFNQAFNRHDVTAMMAWMTGDCIFENTYPPPAGTRYEGQAAVRAFWEEFFHSSPQAVLEFEEIFAAGERCVVRWLYRWVSSEGQRGYVRGVDIFRLRQGKIAEKLSYVKG